MAAARTTAIIIFGLLPSLLICYFSIKGVANVPAYFVAGRYMAGLFTAVVGFTCLAGIISLLRQILGAALPKLRWGLIAGLFATTTWIAAPFVYMILAHLDLYEPPHRSGWDNYGIGVAFAALSTGPAIVYLVLAVLSWKRTK